VEVSYKHDNEAFGYIKCGLKFLGSLDFCLVKVVTLWPRYPHGEIVFSYCTYTAQFP
jgi:hypothetical protein